ncbi:MAG: Phage Tail Collar Domain protein [Syntrophorhabdus sp. PtaU1.Bin058]|nr:MAG: Phage Tail Collar Domain protein [Syntrophorhabdus sp. PtaU1.Bin058]
MDYLMGSITMFGFNWAPVNWAICNGATMSIQQNTALFALIGTTFGGDGANTFGLPNLQDRVPVGFGQKCQFGKSYGSDTVTLTQNNIPAHTHTIQQGSGTTVTLSTPVVTVNASDAQADANKPTSNYWAKAWSGSAVISGYHNAHNVTMASDAVQVSMTASFNPNNLSAVGPSGAVQPISLLQPSLTLNYAICTSGIFPVRP